MRLSTIKLAGFKSFVDPTILHFPTALTGIVGPNGCGKSNVIDAIRWVMGESAASRLRGDAITDVIFSGSGNRKPVGTATIELIFDNSDGLITGEYANFGEISVKRTVSRDGQSSYFLNSGRCRRRDIVDVFLGTGLGARSYSIIEQGMISQIVEARPEDLRHHLEEAAGISKYKERRKETESRIKSTRENLARLDDVRGEVVKNLEHLNRQARNAERWQKLKAEAARLEAELRLLTLRGDDAAVDAAAERLGQARTGLERQLAEQRELEARIEEVRERQIGATDTFNAAQGQVYRVGADIARVEQQIAHNRDLAERLARAGRETEQQLAEITAHAAADREQIGLLTAALAQVQPAQAELDAAVGARSEALKTAEQAIIEWQSAWDQHAKDASAAAQGAEVERTRLDYLDRQSNELGRRREQLSAERAHADLGGLDQLAAQLAGEQLSQRGRVDELTAQAGQRKTDHSGLTEQLKDAQTQLSQLRQQLESVKGRRASLEALQHAALSQDVASATRWLGEQGLERAERVGAALRVDDGWEAAVEVVLGGWIKAVVADAPHAAAQALGSVTDFDLALVGATPGSGAPGTLAAKVQGPRAVMALLAKVRTSESLSQALDLARRLAADESVVTPNGEWLGADWMRVDRGADAGSGVIARERELASTATEQSRLQAEVEKLGARIDQLKGALAEAEVARDDAQRELYNTQRRLSELAGQVQSQQGKIDTARQRGVQLDQDLSGIGETLASNDEQTRAARAQLDRAVAQMGTLEGQRQSLDGRRRELLEAREEARSEAREAQDLAHRHALDAERKRAALASLDQALTRLIAQEQSLSGRRDEIAEQLAGGSQPQEALDAERKTYLEQRLLVDRELVAARKALDEIDSELRRFDADRHRIEQAVNASRETEAQLRLDEQALRLRADQLRAQILEAGFELDALSAEINPEADAGQWRERLAEVENRLRRLEPVNLAAISESNELAERKIYLDAQFTDLNTALETLEGAIRKIDRETRTRFKETFDKVNQGMGELFPRLFGGGHAHLEMTSDDLLDAGITIMARPPGKRVSNISLLSGGEKALTAVALVFSIFRLNPSPFCLLDEVDAPLDEANVGRFCALVAEMSERVQFIVVTHNKITMEHMTQLCGVTMREAGVSRLVQVDLEEAAKLAQTV